MKGDSRCVFEIDIDGILVLKSTEVGEEEYIEVDVLGAKTKK